MVGRRRRKLARSAAAAPEGEATCKPRPPMPSPVALRKFRRLRFITRRCSRNRRALNAFCLCGSVPELELLRRDEFYGAEQAGLQQWVVLFPQTPHGERIAAGRAGFARQQPGRPALERTVGVALAVFGQLLVADEPVRPEIDDRDLDGVLSSPGRGGDIQAIG